MRIPFFFIFIGCLVASAQSEGVDKRAIKSKPVVSKKSETIEGSGAPSIKAGPGVPSDLEIQGSGNGYGSDDEDGDDIQGSGAPPDVVEGSGRTGSVSGIINRPQQSTSTTTTQTPIATGTRSTTTTHAVFNPVAKLPDPVVHVDQNQDSVVVTEIEPTRETTLSSTATVPTTTPRRIQPAVPPEDIPSGSAFSPIPKPGIIAALIGGAVIGLITAVLLVMFIVHRMRKKDEGSYALDEPKPRPYSNYPYSKANTKEFYA